MSIFDEQVTQIPQDKQDNIEPEFVKRRRGRPKKNQVIGNYEKKKKPLDNIPMANVHVREAPLNKVKDEIILHFPLITLSDISRINNNNFPKERVNDPHDIFTINDGNYSSSDYNNDSESNNIAIIELKQQVDEQKYIINNLNNEISNYKTLLNRYDLANRNVSKINVLMVNTDDNNIIIPETTDIACWWCGYNFTDTQCILPENVYNDVWYVGGNYCCVECAAADNFARNDSSVWNRYSLLKQLYNIENIIPAPDKRVFTKFGGTVIYEDFKKNAHKCDRSYRLIMPPMASIIPLVEESVIDSTRVSITMNDLKRNAKLKRTKPLPNVKDNLFKCL
jgi:hypothetical protein